jgi:hypothetical protein
MANWLRASPILATKITDKETPFPRKSARVDGSPWPGEVQAKSNTFNFLEVCELIVVWGNNRKGMKWTNATLSIRP